MSVATDIKREWKKLPLLAKLGIIFGGSYLGYRSVRAITDGITRDLQDIQIQQQWQTETQQLIDQGQQLSYPLSQYVIFADGLYEAMAGPGTDEDSIMQIFRALKNSRDFAQLNSAFGKKQSATLAMWIRGDLDAEEIQEVNSILMTAGIQYQF